MRRFIYLAIVSVLATMMVLPSFAAAQQQDPFQIGEDGAFEQDESGGAGGAAPGGPALPLPGGQGGGGGQGSQGGGQGGGGGGAGQGGAGQNVTVSMEDNYFSPAQITVEPGTTVTWVQNGSNPHTTTSYDGLWDSGIIAGGSGQAFSYTFTEPGTYTYFCRPHEAQGMVGTVIVSSSSGGASAQGGGGGAQEQGGGTTAPLPASGGAGGISPSVLLPAAALLLGSGVVGYALVRRR